MSRLCNVLAGMLYSVLYFIKLFLFTAFNGDLRELIQGLQNGQVGINIDNLSVTIPQHPVLKYDPQLM